MNKDKPINIVLVDDHRLMRAGLRALIESFGRFHVCAECSSAEEAEGAIAANQPEIAVLDIQLPGKTGISLLETLPLISKNTVAIMLSMHDSSKMIKSAFDRGAKGYLLKECAEQDLEKALDTVLAGHSFLPSSVKKWYRDELIESKNIPVITGLTARQSETFYYLARGESIKEVAFRMGISRKTVESHRYAAMQKLELFSNKAILDYAVLRGWISGI